LSFFFVLCSLLSSSVADVILSSLDVVPSCLYCLFFCFLLVFFPFLSHFLFLNACFRGPPFSTFIVGFFLFLVYTPMLIMV